MSMFTVTVHGDREVAATFHALPDAVRIAVRKKIMALTLELQRKVKVEHLSGPTGAHSLSVGVNSPKHTGGQLRASVFQEMSDTATSIVGRVGFSADVAYAAIHEFGGNVNVPEIVPTKAKALHWLSGGKDVFAMRVRAHTVQIPQRAPLRTAFDEMKDDIREGLKDAVREGLKSV